MPSVARVSFDKNVKDVERLIEIHTSIGGGTKGRKWGLEVLNKSAIVLITAFWEAYCEDIAAEGLAHLVNHSKTADALPTELKKLVAADLKRVPHDLEIWKLAGDGWKANLTDRLQKLKAERDRKVNTPKTAQIDQLFLNAVGIESMSKNWKWHKNPSVRVTEKLDRFVELRGSIAHRGSHSEGVKKAQVEAYLVLVTELVKLTGGVVNKHVKAATGVPLWRIRLRRVVHPGSQN